MNHISRLLMAAAICGALVSASVQADTFWSTETPATVSDLLNADNWSNGAPVTEGNPGFIDFSGSETAQTITVTDDFKPGTAGQTIDLTFGKNSQTNMNKAFVPLGNLPSGQTASVTMRLQDNANVYVSGNFWGGTNDANRAYDLGGKEYILYQYYTGDSVFSCNEWWTGMTAKTKILISDNASVTSRGGSYSGLGWDDSSFGSVIDMTDNASLSVSSNNLDFRGDGTKLNMYDNSTVTSKILNITSGQAQVNLSDKAKISATDININAQGALALSGNSTVTASNNLMVSNTGNISLSGNSAITVNNMFKLDNQSVLIANDNAKLTVAKDAALDRDGAITVSDNAQLAFGAQLKIGDVNAGTNGGAVFNQTGGKVTVATNTFFSYHKDATVNLSGGEFYANGNQLYVTDQKDCIANINMSGVAYLQAKDLRLSQHGHTNLSMTDNSQIKVNDFNVAYNYSVGDNVETVVTMGDSSTVTANNLYFFGMNNNGAAYGSLTLNDNAAIIVANDTLIGKGASTGILDGKTYSGIVNLNGSSIFETTAYTATAGSKSQTNVNGTSTLTATTITIGPESEFNIDGGTVNASNLNNTGSVTLANGSVNLGSYGLITSTEGTFNATGGAINPTVPGNVTYNNGDQMLVGLFADAATANSVAGKTAAPEGWQASATTVNGKDAVVVNYGSAPAGDFKVWKEDASGSMSDASNWDGDVNNPTGYVFSGTNSMTNITGKTVIVGGTNTLSGETPADAAIVLAGGTAQYNDATVKGAVLINGGTFNDGGYLRIGDGNDANAPAVFNQTDGTVNVTGLTFFSYHGDADVNLSGGKFYANGAQLYVTDQRGRTADIAMSGDAYLQAKDLRLSQHGNTNLTMTDNSHLKADTFNIAYNYDNGDNVETYVTMSGNSLLEAANFRAFQGNNDRNHKGTSYASFIMTDNARAIISGNAWGGSNDLDGNVPALMPGKDFNFEMTFSGNSYFSAQEFWMGMAGKIHLTIEDNATVVAGNKSPGFSGMGWCKEAAGSLLEIKGGTLQVEAEHFFVGRRDTTTSTGYANVKQTGGNAIYKNVQFGQNESSYEISGADSVMSANAVLTYPGSTFRVADGTVNLGELNNTGAFVMTDGTLNLGKTGITGDASGSIQLAGGTITAGAEALAEDQRGSWSTNLNATLTGAKTDDADTRVTFAPAAGASIEWNGALSGDGGLILDGEGTFTLAQAPAYTGATAIEKGTMTLAQGGTLYNLTGGSVNDDGSVAVAAAIDASGQELTIDNAVMTKFVGSIKAQSILKTGYGTLKIYADEQNKVVADTFTVSDSELDFKGYYEGDLEVINGAFFSPGNSIGEANITGNIAFITDNADSNGFAYFEFGDFTGADENHDLLVLSNSSLFNANDEAGVVLLDFANDDAANWASAGVDYLLVKNGAFEDGKDYTSWLSPTFTDLFGLEGRADGLYLIGLAAPPEPGSGVPEPSTWGLLALGVAGLLYWRKRK